MSADKPLSTEDLFTTSLSNFLKGVENEYDAYEGLLYAITLFSSASGGFIDFKGDMDYFDFTCGSMRMERHGATSTLKLWDLDLPQKGRMIQKDKILLYNSDGALIGLTEPKYNLSHKTITLAFMFTHNAIDQLTKFTSLKDSHYRDELTGVHNRLAFEKDISHAVLFKQRFNKPVFLMMIDLNNFKLVNDKLGHPMGDRVLKSVCHLIQKCTVHSGHLYRVGGDEFYVILKGIPKEQCENIAQQIQEIVHQSPGGILTSCSVGLSEYTDQKIEELIAAADKKMYENKRRNSERRAITDSGFKPDKRNEERRKTTDQDSDQFTGKANDEKTNPKCEKCGKPMVKKNGKHGMFFSCSGFPRCKGTKSISKEKGTAQ